LERNAFVIVGFAVVVVAQMRVLRRDLVGDS
jgi:hypothetical protein